MTTNNFQLLQARWPQLYEYAKFAEKYVHGDPHTSIMKLRCFAEQLVGILFRELDLPYDRNDSFFDKLTSNVFLEVVDESILQKLHAIRMLGNKAAHGKNASPKDALSLLYDAYLIGQWLFKTYSGSFDELYPAFTEPTPPSGDGDKMHDKNEKLEKQLEAVKAELALLQGYEQEAHNEKFKLQKTLDEAKMKKFKDASSNAAASFDLSSGEAREHISLNDAFSQYTLTDDQIALVANLRNFLNSKTDKVFLLKGYAGTGKTFITKGLTEYFRSIGRNFVLAAPTGKASKVIAEKTKCKASTIHKAIYSFKDIAEYRDDDLEGSETYKYYAQLAVNGHSADTVFIVDEASMVSDVYQEEEFFRFGSGYLLQDFLEFVNLDHNDHNKKVIFIGDDAQLPPVGMKFSPALDQAYLNEKYNNSSLTFELREVVRQKTDSGVISNSIKLRESLKGRVFNQLTLDFTFPDIDEVSYQNLIDQYLTSCHGKINGEAIILAHSNADVAAYNRRIREHFFPNEPEITGGDKIMAVSNNYGYGIDIFNGDFGLVRNVLGKPEQRTRTIRRKNTETDKVEEIDVLLTFRDVNIGFKDLDGIAHFFEAKISRKPTL
ncbi:AAA family ATPase [Rhodobacteraceae bacterium nBUS_22]